MGSIVLDSPVAGGSVGAAPPGGSAFPPASVGPAFSSAVPPSGTVGAPASVLPNPTMGPPSASLGTVPSPTVNPAGTTSPSVAANPTVAPPSGSTSGDPLSVAGQFLGSVASGAWDGVTGIAHGLGSLAGGAWGLATGDQQTWDQAGHMAGAAGNFVGNAVTDPVGTAQQVGSAAVNTWDSFSNAYQQAAANGQGAAFLGHAVGQVGVLAAGAFIPGADEAEGAGLLAEGADAADGVGALADATTATADSAAETELGATAEGATGAADPLYGRTQQAFDDLARDPAHGSQIDVKSIQERQVGLDIEARGDVPGPITRDPSGSAEFIDGSGQAWDVKGFNSNFPANKGGFSLARDAGKVDKSLSLGENVMLDTSKMSQSDIDALRAEGEQRGWGGQVQWWP